MEGNQTEQLVKQLKKKKIRKYVLMALALALVVYGISIFSIEPPDAKLPDGQGNIVSEQNTSSGDSGIAEETDSQGDVAAGEDVSGGENTEPGEEAAGSQETESGGKKAGTEDFAGNKGEEQTFTEEEKAELDAKDVEIDNSEDFTASNSGNVALKPEVAQPVTVTLEIRCDTLSENMDYLENPAIVDYIPEDGVILARTEYQGTTDNTVFDVLNTLCRNNDIQLDFKFTPVYESYYIRGINFLYEFDGGPASGWMYKVNGWFPNYGCSSYYLSDGDEIVWCYTCRGYGADVGDTRLNG